MNIDEHFEHAKQELVVSQAHVQEHDYEDALTALAESYAHTRALLEKVYKLHALKAEVTSTGEYPHP